MPMSREWVQVDVTDENPNKTSMECYLARPEGEGPWPGVILFMEIFGINRHIQDVAERLAGEGYVVMAINYYHRTTPNLELGYSDSDVEQGQTHKRKTNREGVLADVKEAISYLNSRDDVTPKNQFGTIGFCFGGHVGYIATTRPEIVATACYYGGGIAVTSPGENPDNPATVSYTPQIKGEILCFFGGNDPLIPQEHTETIENALRDSAISHRVIRYPGVGHGFNCEARESYHAAAALDAWGKTLHLFESRLKTGAQLS